MGQIVVIGSLNMDLVIECSRFPKPGETLSGHSFSTIPGGKGANQAAAASRLGAKTAMIGKVGSDSFGEILINSLKNFGVNTSGVLIAQGEKTGIAMITVSGGENMIVLSKGSNDLLNITDIDANANIIDNSDIILMQLEIPLKTVQYIIERYKGKKKIFLNPAPIMELDSQMINGIDFITPNEHEASKLCGVNTHESEGVNKALDVLKEMGIKYPVITMGSKGVAYYNGQENKFAQAEKVIPLDTTAAGDIFTGALATATLEGKDMDSAVMFAQKAAAIAVTRFGAQSSIPTREEVDLFAKL